MIPILDLAAGTLPASFRGIPFCIPNGQITAGRRVQKFLFPGADLPAYADLGLLDGPIEVAGIIVGDDYIQRGQAMRQAMRTPGPALLVHPWLGQISVILKEPGSVSYTQTEYRVARVRMTVELSPLPAPAAQDTLAGVTGANTNLLGQAANLLAVALAPLQLTTAAFGVIEGVCGEVAGILGAVAGGISALAGAVAQSVAALQAVGGIPAGPGYAAALYAAIAAPAAAIAQASATLLPAAIGPGDAPPATTIVDPRVTTAALLAAATQIAALSGPAPAGLVLLAAAASSVASAADAGTDIAFTSQQDAAAWLAQELAAIDAVSALATAQAPFWPGPAGTVWNALTALRGAVLADINAAIGRLPAVTEYSLANALPVWLVAQALVGDTPSLLLSTYADLVQRNAVANPALLGPGSIEALVA